MAFNPFHGFRKHQKTLFAIMVIVCMFVFILQSGAGDVFSRSSAGSVPAGARGRWSQRSTAPRFTRPTSASCRGSATWPPCLSCRRPHRPSRRRRRTAWPGRAWPRPSSCSTSRRVSGRSAIFPGTRTCSTSCSGDTKADKLGIVLTEVDVRKLINRIAGKDVFGGKPFTSSAFVTQVVHQLGSQRQNRAITADELQRAVTEEFRVVLAQEALLGRGPGVFGGNAMFGRAPDSAIPRSRRASSSSIIASSARRSTSGCCR